MLDITVICVGKLKEKYYKDACAEYIKRLGAFCRITVTELAEVRKAEEPSPAEIDAALAKEAAAVRENIPKGAALIALTPEGQEMSSPELARTLEKMAAAGTSKVCFLIGSSDGIDAGLKKEAKMRLSMSPMTFPHHLARVMLLEQVYRAMNISSGGKYHK